MNGGFVHERVILDRLDETAQPARRAHPATGCHTLRLVHGLAH